MPFFPLFAALPLLLDGLLSPDLLRLPDFLLFRVLLLFVMRGLDIVFQVTPQFHEGVYIGWLDLAALVALGGIWVAAFCHYLRGRPLLPINDPYLEEALANHGSH